MCYIESYLKTHISVLTELKVRIESYGPRIFPSFYSPSAKPADHESKGKKGGSLTYSKDRDNGVTVCPTVRERFFSLRETTSNL